MVDFEKIELLDGSLSFNIWFLFICIGIFVHFIIQSYQEYRKTGIKVDIWNSTIFQLIILPFIFMYPFCSSYYNFFSIGKDYIYAAQYVEYALFITLVGYGCMLLGRWIFDTSSNVKEASLSLLGKIIRINIENDMGLKVLYAMLTIFYIYLAIYTFQNDMLFNGRGLALQFHEYRAVGNFMISVFYLTVLYFGIRILQYKKNRRTVIVALIALCLLAFSWGARIHIFMPILQIAIYYYMLNPKIRIKYIVLAGTIILIGVLILGILRNTYGNTYGNTNDYSFIFVEVIYSLLYGSTFTDCRDFAWMLSGFHDDFWGGITYVTGMLSFIPSDIWDFRRINSWSVHTTELIGWFDPYDEHPGLRGGFFAEAFFNFSYIGVIFMGILSGYTLRMADVYMKFYINHGGDVIHGYIKGIPYFFVTFFAMTAGMFGMYVFIAFHMIALCINILYRFLVRCYGKLE